MNSLWQTIRYEARMLLHSRASVLIAALTLGLGVGANTAVFSLVKALILQPLPGVEQASQLAVLGSRTQSGDVIPLSYPNYTDLRDDSREVFSSLAASAMTKVSIGPSGQATQGWAELVSGNYFSTLGVRLKLGRGISPTDDSGSAESSAVVISYRLWQKSFGGNPGIIGHTINLDNHPFTIVGVTTADFRGSIVGLSFDLFAPIAAQKQIYSFESGSGSLLEQRDTQWLVCEGRLLPGISMQQAQTVMSGLGVRLLKAYPNDQIAERAVLFPLWRSPFGAQPYLLPAGGALFVIALLILFMACLNVATIILHMANRRIGELAMRMALGASRSTVIWHILLYSVLISAVGGIAGLAGAWATSRFLENVNLGGSYPVALRAGIDIPVFCFSLLLTVAAGLFSGLFPAIRVSRTNLLATLHTEGGSRHSGRNRLGDTILIIQIAFSLVLLVAASLLIHDAALLRQIDPGFRTSNVTMAAIDLKAGGYDRQTGPNVLRRILQQLQSQPGVQASSAAWQAPLTGPAGITTGVSVEGYEPRLQESMIFHYNLVGPGYLRSLGIPLLEGRDFAITDDTSAPIVMIVNKSFADRFWPGRSAIGRSIEAYGQKGTVIGVAADAKYTTLSAVPMGFVYLPLLQNYQPQLLLQAMVPEASARSSTGIDAAVRAADPGLQTTGEQTVGDLVMHSTDDLKRIAGLLGMAGLLGLALAAVGVYGSAAQLASRRLPEFAIRTALGAQRGHLLWLMLSRSLRLALLGGAVGLLLSAGVEQLLRGAFHLTQSFDPLGFSSASLLLAAVVLIASWVPTLSLFRLTPANLLRNQ